MILSQVGKYEDNLDTIAPIVNLLIKYSSDNNPIIRYAAFEAIG